MQSLLSGHRFSARRLLSPKGDGYEVLDDDEVGESSADALLELTPDFPVGCR